MFVDHSAAVSGARALDAAARAAIHANNLFNTVSVVEILGDLIYVRLQYVPAVASEKRRVVLVFGQSPSLETKIGHFRARELKEPGSRGEVLVNHGEQRAGIVGQTGDFGV